MKVGLNYEGRGFGATIHNDDDVQDIFLKVKKTNEPGFGGTIMTIKQDSDIIALDKNDIIALRDYLVQITPTL